MRSARLNRAPRKAISMFSTWRQTCSKTPAAAATWKFRMDPLRALRAVHAARRVCDWDFAASLEREARRVAEPQSPINGAAPLLLLSLPQATPAEQLATAQKYARLVMTAASPSVRPPAVRRDGRIRLRVGYFSGDFCDHATAHLIAGVIE